MSEVEQELVKITGFKSPGKKTSRQDYLAGLARAVSALSDDDFDNVSNEAAAWHEAAVDAMNDEKDLPEFDELETEEPDEDQEEQSDDEAESENEAEEAAEDAAVSSEEDEPEGESESEEEAEEPEPEPKPKTKKAANGVAGKTIAASKTPKKAPEAKAKGDPRYDKLTGEKNRYGIIIGTKTHDALMLYEKGTTAAQLNEEVGGRFYNVLTRMKAEGHKVEKREGGIWKLTHKDDLKKKAK